MDLAISLATQIGALFIMIGQVVEKNDTPQIRGMIHKVDYMLEIVD